MPKIGIPILEDMGFESNASLHFGNASFFAFIEVEGGQIKTVNIKANEEAKLAKKKGITAAHFLINEKVDIVIAGSLGEGPFHVLRDSLRDLSSPKICPDRGSNSSNKPKPVRENDVAS